MLVFWRQTESNKTFSFSEVCAWEMFRRMRDKNTGAFKDLDGDENEFNSAINSRSGGSANELRVRMIDNTDADVELEQDESVYFVDEGRFKYNGIKTSQSDVDVKS